MGRITKKWLEFRSEWLKTHPPDEFGNYICYICGDDVWYTEVTLDHIISRSRAPELRFVESNIGPAHAKCNEAKGSLNLEEYLLKKGDA